MLHDNQHGNNEAVEAGERGKRNVLAEALKFEPVVVEGRGFVDLKVASSNHCVKSKIIRE